ncbi:MAG: universal stress protein [Anaerolineae bacterium]|nr:universal stress protein [Anaerolineae bacterium]
MSSVEPAGFLSLSDVTPDPKAARLLPPAVARRCRALPIALDGDCVTVAMADPTDRAAREAVMAALQASSALATVRPSQVYLVQGDPALIDDWLRLAEVALAPEQPAGASPTEPPIGLWLPEPLAHDGGEVVAYAEQLAALLAAPLRRFNPSAGRPDEVSFPSHPERRLLVLPCLSYGQVEPLLEGGRGAAALLVCRPRWPLRRLLLIVRGDPVDDAALAWAAWLARASQAAVTALMVAPHVPTTPSPPTGDDIANLLSPHDAAGHRAQRTAQSLAALHLDAVLHLRQGPPETVIRRELASAPYDLGITGIAARGAEAQWRLRPLLRRLLPDLPCPLLVTGYR